MYQHSTLRVGGPAEYFYRATDRSKLVEIVKSAQDHEIPHILLGDGSNVCIHDSGIRGLVIRNSCAAIELCESTRVDAGHGLSQLFLKSLHAGFTGLEWAVGIPGTVGGALVSNAGAYGGNICDLVESIEVVEKGVFKIVGPDWMEFSYRDSRLRRDATRPACLIGATLKLSSGCRAEIRRTARDIQMQRILKQPWEPSAGSFFKNIHDKQFAINMPDLPENLKARGVVTSAFLLDRCDCKGLRVGGAAISRRHANFVVNCGGATAADIRGLASEARARVHTRYGIDLSEEVLYLGDWPD